MDNCKRCHKFHEPNNCAGACTSSDTYGSGCGTACNLGIKTLPQNPENKNLWFKHQLPKGLDPVLSNIYNGCWICNIEPQQHDNQKLCKRNFFDGPNIPPYKPIVDIENQLRYPGLSNNKYYKK